jgi:hypothetical protein
LTTEIAAPLAMASAASSAPFSSCRTAINAEASRTASTLASGTPAAGFALAAFGLRLRAPIRDQLVNQALAWGHVGEQAT